MSSHAFAKLVSIMFATLVFTAVSLAEVKPMPSPTSSAASKSSSLSPPQPKSKLEGRYRGRWVTTWHKKLDGTTNCEVKQLAVDRWQGRFWGEWQQVPFDYTVEFTKKKPASSKAAAADPVAKEVAVEGKATIDGATYDWVGQLSADKFDIQFTGSRYNGSLELSRVSDKKLAKSSAR